jgi:diphosphomevalonate decarboxylase
MKPIEASAPSNIALIKYMGKTKSEVNLPSNASLSFTLEHLRSFVVLEPSESGSDDWKPLPGFARMELSEKGRTKFINHFGRLKTQWQIPGHYVISSANNFPSDCGFGLERFKFRRIDKSDGLAGRNTSSKTQN